ncbi:MAG: hypothetical protein K2H85_09215 [Allobaculum sp.]|nr:hypothetical protein [Allobaculum sp.]
METIFSLLEHSYPILFRVQNSPIEDFPFDFPKPTEVILISGADLTLHQVFLIPTQSRTKEGL